MLTQESNGGQGITGSAVGDNLSKASHRATKNSLGRGLILSFVEALSYKAPRNPGYDQF